MPYVWFTFKKLSGQPIKARLNFLNEGLDSGAQQAAIYGAA